MLDDKGKSKRFGFVSFNTPEEADKAYKYVSKQKNHPVKYINFAQRMNDRRNLLANQFNGTPTVVGQSYPNPPLPGAAMHQFLPRHYPQAPGTFSADGLQFLDYTQPYPRVRAPAVPSARSAKVPNGGKKSKKAKSPQSSPAKKPADATAAAKKPADATAAAKKPADTAAAAKEPADTAAATKTTTEEVIQFPELPASEEPRGSLKTVVIHLRSAKN